MTYYSNSSYIKSYDDNCIYLQLHNLIHAIKYIFYIQIFNSIGNSTMSLCSDEYVYYSNDKKIVSYDIVKMSNWKIHYYYISLIDREQSIDVVTVSNNNKQIVTYEVWTCFWSPKSFIVESQITWTIPKLLNDPNISKNIDFINANDLRNKIAFTYRGGLPLIIKVLAIQKAGALGIVIVDNHENSDYLCHSYNQSCLPGATKALGEGFGRLDKPKLWSNLKIPVVFILNSLANELATYIYNIKISNISNTDDTFIIHDEL
uniref:PA domain-containing protein n=1 Tax=Chromulina nebulosa TaxID=96789 RepID=A0A7S0SS48_9STRA